MRPDPTLAPLLFLDFDGVLHPNGTVLSGLFARADALMCVLDEHPELEVVVSSSWRFHHGWDELLGILPNRLAGRVTASTGVELPGKCQRHREIDAFVKLQATTNPGNRPWRALDDASWEFPPGCTELIPCDGALGLQHEQMEELSQWLGQLDSCRTAVSMQRPINRPELVESANRLLANAATPSVALLQRALRIGHNEAIALLGNYLMSAKSSSQGVDHIRVSSSEQMGTRS